MESTEKNQRAIELPEGLLDYDYEEWDDHEPLNEEIADAIVPKINKFLEQFNLEDKRVAMKMIDDELMRSGRFPEDTYPLVVEVYKRLFLSRLE